MKNIIVRDGNCGPLNGGYVEYLVNTDNTTKYSVTILTRWTQGFENKQRTEVFSIPPAGRIYLGCTLAGATPEIIYSRSVVAEI